MTSWPSSKARQVLSALYRIGWTLKRQSGSHKTFSPLAGPMWSSHSTPAKKSDPERLGEAPEAALITLRAQGRLGEGVSCKIETGRALVVAGLHPATGGSGQSACSGDMLLEALVACAGVTLNAVATALGIELRDASLLAEGDLDFRGTLGVSKEVPAGFQSIRLQ